MMGKSSTLLLTMKNLMTTIRKITSEDIEWINKNLKSDMNTLWISNEFCLLSHEKSFWNPWFVLIALDTILNEYKLVGFILWESDSYRRYGEITKLYIYDGWRGWGRWKMLLDKMEKYFTSIGMSSIELLTFTEKGRDFYVKNWYEVLADYEKKYHENDKLKRRIFLCKKIWQ